MALLPGITDTNFHKVAIGETKLSDPDGPSYPPEVVVKEAIASLKSRSKPSVISGPKYRFLTAITTRLLSRKRMIEIMGKDSPGMK